MIHAEGLWIISLLPIDRRCFISSNDVHTERHLLTVTTFVLCTLNHWIRTCRVGLTVLIRPHVYPVLYQLMYVSPFTCIASDDTHLFCNYSMVSCFVCFGINGQIFCNQFCTWHHYCINLGTYFELHVY